MRHDARGFTLLEAIVALAILTAGTMALFAGLNGALRSIERVEAAAQFDTGTQNAIALIETINPMLRPEGEERIGEVLIRWRSRVIAGPSEGLTEFYSPGLYEVGLYELEAELWRNAELEGRFTLRRAGWRQIRQPEVL